MAVIYKHLKPCGAVFYIGLKKVVGKFNYNPIEVCSTPAVITVKFN